MTSKYPDNWDTIAQIIKTEANWQCEHCHHEHDPETRHTLTVHHLDGNTSNNTYENLVALCQRCHLHVQGRYVPGQGWIPPAPAWARKRGLAPPHITLVGCSKTKLPQGAAACDLYQGTLFIRAREWAETCSDAWYILSALYGLLYPDEHIDPYQVALADLDAEEHRIWAYYVYRDIQDAIEAHQFYPPPAHITILAGKLYRQYLTAELITAGYTVNCPIRGLNYGQQVAWLKESIQAEGGNTW